MIKYEATYTPIYFKKDEFFCRCGCVKGLKYMNPCILMMADNIRGECGFPIIVNSSIRCEDHNLAIGGQRKSFHLKGMAMDLSPAVTTHDNICKLQDVSERLNAKGGVGLYNNFVHIDCRPYKARWDERTV